jgi:hypothetical protein
MEYHRDPKNQIYADLAYRIGKVVCQYERLELQEEKFEATLCIAALQHLLTSCQEYVNNMTKPQQKGSIFAKQFSKTDWGINNSTWGMMHFNEKKTLQNYIRVIRNAMSHPTETDIAKELPSTGFSTVADESGRINKFVFINSPDVRKNRQKYFNTRQEAEEYIVENEISAEVLITETWTDNGNKYVLTLDGKAYARFSKIEIAVGELRSFVKALSNYLAQPIQKEWDGITIKNLIAA